MLESVMKGIGMLIAAVVLMVVVTRDEKQRAYEKELVHTDPVAAAEAEFSEGHVFFFVWNHEVAAGRSANGKMQREWVSTVLGEENISPIVLEQYPEREDMLILNPTVLYDGNRGTYKRGLLYASQFNVRMAQLAARAPLPVTD